MASTPALLAADDFAGLSARLTSAGIPPHVVKIALMVAIREHFERRQLQLGLRDNGAVITRNPISHATSESAEIEAARAALKREEQEVIRAVVGDELLMSSDGRSRIAGNLPHEKAFQLMKIISDYKQIEMQLYLDNPDRGAPANREKVALLQKEQRADIERLLTAGELLDYDLRTSAVGGNLRNRLGMFSVTEGEFRALYAAFKTADEAADVAGVPRRLRDRDAVFEPEFRRVLGDARYRELQLARQQETERIRTFGEISSLTRSLNLPSHVTNEVLVLQAQFRPRLEALEAARVATPEQRNAQITALAREAESKLSHVLGAQGFATYRARYGHWLNRVAAD